MDIIILFSTKIVNLSEFAIEKADNIFHKLALDVWTL